MTVVAKYEAQSPVPFRSGLAEAMMASGELSVLVIHLMRKTPWIFMMLTSKTVVVITVCRGPGDEKSPEAQTRGKSHGEFGGDEQLAVS